MKTQLIKFTALLGMLLLVVSSLTHAGDAPVPKPESNSSPYDVVDGVTNDLIAIVRNGEAAMKDDPKGYFAEVRGVMSPVVDFKHIARNVMGAKHWKSASVEQKEKFTEVFTLGMVETYAKGMASFADYDVSLQKPKEDIGEKKKVIVIQKYKGAKGTVRVSYTMGKHRSGEWKLINIVLDGVNLGKTLKAQFSQAVKESKGNLDAAINGWGWEA